MLLFRWGTNQNELLDHMHAPPYPFFLEIRPTGRWVSRHEQRGNYKTETKKLSEEQDQKQLQLQFKFKILHDSYKNSPAPTTCTER